MSVADQYGANDRTVTAPALSKPRLRTSPVEPGCRRYADECIEGTTGAPRADHLYAVDVDTLRSTAIWRMLSHRASAVVRRGPDALGFISRARFNASPRRRGSAR